MIYGSVCSGIEAASVAWEPLGWSPAFFSENEKFPSAVLAHHFGSNMPGEQHCTNGVPNYGDLNGFKSWPDHSAGSGRPIDLLVGGTPCQSFSIAGLRQGMDDPRGNLALTYISLVDRYRPKWVVWENVPGVLSSWSNEAESAPENGEWEGWQTNDFDTFIAELEAIGYYVSWRVLDAQYVCVDGFERAVPQRRQRVFVVGHSSDWRYPAAVLSDPEGLFGHTPPSRKTGQGVAADVAPSLVSSGRGVERTGDIRGQDPVIPVRVVAEKDISGTVSAKWAKWAKGTGDPAGDECQNLVAFGAAPPLTQNYHADHESREGLLVAHTLSAEGFDASEDGTGRGVPIVPIAFSSKDHSGDAQFGVSPTLRSMNNDASHANAGGQVAIAIQERAVSANPNTGPDGVGVRDDGAAFTLEARSSVQAVAFAQNTRDEVRLMGGDCGITGAIAAEPGTKQQTYVALHDPVAWSEELTAQTGVAPAVQRGGSGGRHDGVFHNWAVRRLMPIECERLQGFPDGYTNIPWRNKPVSPDGPRYKALGNSMAVNVMRYIGQRIQMVEDIINEAAA